MDLIACNGIINIARLCYEMRSRNVRDCNIFDMLWNVMELYNIDSATFNLSSRISTDQTNFFTHHEEEEDDDEKTPNLSQKQNVRRTDPISISLYFFSVAFNSFAYSNTLLGRYMVFFFVPTLHRFDRWFEFPALR